MCLRESRWHSQKQQQTFKHEHEHEHVAAHSQSQVGNLIWLASPEHEAAQTRDCTAAGLGRYSATQSSTATEHIYAQQGTRRTEQEATGWKPRPSRCYGNSNQTRGGGRTWGMGWRWACRIREVVEDALAGPLKVKCCVHPIWLRWTNVQSGLGAGRLLPQSRMRVRAAGVAGKGTRKLNTERS